MISPQVLHQRAARVLPEVVQTSGMLLQSCEENHLAALLFPLRRKSSGMLLFELAQAIADRLASTPLDYLQQATHARAALGRRQPCFSYAPWRSARVPAALVPMLCAQLPAGLDGEVRAHFTRKDDGKALLVVMPELRRVLYLWRD